MRFKRDWEGELKSLLFSVAVAAFICVDEIQRIYRSSLHFFEGDPSLQGRTGQQGASLTNAE